MTFVCTYLSTVPSCMNYHCNIDCTAPAFTSITPNICYLKNATQHCDLKQRFHLNEQAAFAFECHRPSDKKNQ